MASSPRQRLHSTGLEKLPDPIMDGNPEHEWVGGRDVRLDVSPGGTPGARRLQIVGCMRLVDCGPRRTFQIPVVRQEPRCRLS